MIGRARIISKNSLKYKKRQNIVLICILILSLIRICIDRNIDTSVIILTFDVCIFCLILLIQLRKIEIVGNCGFSRWFGTHLFYVSDVKFEESFDFIKYRRPTIYKFFWIKSMKYNKHIYCGEWYCGIHKKTLDDNVSAIKGIINSPPKNYVQELIVERKYRSTIQKIMKPGYEAELLRVYGQIVKDAEIIGGLDLRFGKLIPVFEFQDECGKHMTWGLHRISEEELEQKIHKKCSVYYAPGKSECVIEVLQ